MALFVVLYFLLAEVVAHQMTGCVLRAQGKCDALPWEDVGRVSPQGMANKPLPATSLPVALLPEEGTKREYLVK
ncbi:hypothetical protein BEL04_19730 [Mucilaginibacter sp. PPCGB 2223]|nr:hypothetical protein BEL04_19730 [Mucilaginibacter sp. PPCGB 2223]